MKTHLLFFLATSFAGCLKPVAQEPCVRTYSEMPATEFEKAHFLRGPMTRNDAGVWLTEWSGFTDDLTAQIASSALGDVISPGNSVRFLGHWIRPDAVGRLFIQTMFGQEPVELRLQDFAGSNYDTSLPVRTVATYPSTFFNWTMPLTSFETASVCLSAGGPLKVVTLRRDGAIEVDEYPFNFCFAAVATTRSTAFLTANSARDGLGVLLLGGASKALPDWVHACLFTLPVGTNESLDLFCLNADNTQLGRIADSLGTQAEGPRYLNDAGWTLLGPVPDLVDVFLLTDAEPDADGRVGLWAMVRGATPRRLALIPQPQDVLDRPLYGGLPSGNLVLASSADAGLLRFTEYCLE